MSPAAGNLSAVWLQLGAALLCIVAMILLLQKVARRFGSGLGMSSGGPEQIRVLSQRPMGPRLSLALVQVMGRTLLVGVSPQGIRPVADLGEAADAGLASPTVHAPGLGRASVPSSRGAKGFWGIFGFRASRPAGAAFGGSGRAGHAAPSGPQQSSPPHAPSSAQTPLSVQTPLSAHAPSSAHMLSSAHAPSAADARVRVDATATTQPRDRAEAPAGFEAEMSRRLEDLRRRYPTVRELDLDLEGGRP